MIEITSLSVAAALLAFGLSTAPAEALATRTFVSGKGADSGACTRAAPCKTFAIVLTKTAGGGEIDVLDSGEYGAVTITKSISIVNEAPEWRAFSIRFNTGLSLAIENCVVRKFSFHGLSILPSTSSSFSGSNTIASNNGDTGILVQPTGPADVKGVLSKVTTNNNFRGIFVVGSDTTAVQLRVTIVDSVASNNSLAGVAAAASPGHVATEVMLRNVVASYNFNADSAAILRVVHSVVTGNRTHGIQLRRQRHQWKRK